MITILSRKLDKVSLLRVYKGVDKVDFNGSLGQANLHASDGSLKKLKEKYCTVFTTPYTGKFESTALSFTFFSVRNNPAIAIKFCPSKLSDDEWADVTSWFAVLFGVSEVWDNFHISTAEIAVDVRLPYSDLVFLNPGTKTSDKTYHEVGTTYIGARKGRRSFRIYNKQKHLAEKKGKQLTHPLTRIEAIHTGLKLSLNEIVGLKNPFGRFIALRKDELLTLQQKHTKDIELSEFCYQIFTGSTGHDAYWAQSPISRKRIVKIIKPHSIKLNAPDDAWNTWLNKTQNLFGMMKDC